jgi:putative photosynthetic complex assembly protein 2
MAAATAVLAVCGYAMFHFNRSSSDIAIALSFASGLLAWGWTEMSLYMGYITGPRKQRCREGCSGINHFGHAISANLWHELLVIAFAAVIWLTGNATAFWCFTMLWLMHLSARLNVFLGVRNVSAEFVPPHMDVLKGFLRRRNMNWLFPFSCIALSGVTVWLFSRPLAFETSLAAALAAIGLLEHILLMLPLPIERLWHWSLAEKMRPNQNSSHDVNHQNKSIPQRTAMGTLS